MNPAKFPESNCVFGPPSDLEESQCRSIDAFKGEVQGGSCDGCVAVVVAYKFTKEELQYLMWKWEEHSEQPMLYFTMIGGLAPHYPSLSFHDATHPA